MPKIYSSKGEIPPHPFDYPLPELKISRNTYAIRRNLMLFNSTMFLVLLYGLHADSINVDSFLFFKFNEPFPIHIGYLLAILAVVIVLEAANYFTNLVLETKDWRSRKLFINDKTTYDTGSVFGAVGRTRDLERSVGNDIKNAQKRWDETIKEGVKYLDIEDTLLRSLGLDLNKERNLYHEPLLFRVKEQCKKYIKDGEFDEEHYINDMTSNVRNRVKGIGDRLKGFARLPEETQNALVERTEKLEKWKRDVQEKSIELATIADLLREYKNGMGSLSVWSKVKFWGFDVALVAIFTAGVLLAGIWLTLN